MKVHLLYGGVVCIACVFTILAFLTFQDKWKSAEIFQQTIHNAPLRVRLLFFTPGQVNVENWQVGDVSVYHLKTNTESKKISFHITARDSQHGNRFWLRIAGVFQFKEVDIDHWRLLDKAALPGSGHRAFYFSRNLIPFPSPQMKFLLNQVVLEKRGFETVVTPIGPLISDHYFTYIRAPDGELEPLLELWTNPIARPLGIVRARWQDESLNLVSTDTNAVPEIPPVLLEEFDRHTSVEGSCARCHAEGVGGRNLKLESINQLRGATLNLTGALFHHLQAEIVKPDNLMHIHFTEKSKQVFARFSWTHGSFWVKPTKNNRIGISLDASALQGNITIQTSTGHLALEPLP